mgnify:CR=1 FL=1
MLDLPTTPERLAQFSFSNQDSHFRITAAIFRQQKKSILVFPVDPIPSAGQARQAWARAHQSWHNSQNAVLGIQGDDLTEVDFADMERLQSWIQQHFIEHYQAEAQLGIG